MSHTSVRVHVIILFLIVLTFKQLGPCTDKNAQINYLW